MQIFKLINRDLFTSDTAMIPVASIASNYKRDVQNWIKYSGIIPTHMGELRKCDNGYIYYTTTGATYLFIRSK